MNFIFSCDFEVLMRFGDASHLAWGDEARRNRTPELNAKLTRALRPGSSRNPSKTSENLIILGITHSDSANYTSLISTGFSMA